MLFDTTTVTESEYAAEDVRADDAIGIGLKFNWDERHFEMQDGSPIMVNGISAVKEWLNLVVRTKQGRYPIYPADFGGDAMEMIGKKIPKGFPLSEFKQKMLQSIAYNPGIDDMEDFTYDGEYIYITALLTDGTKEVTEIEY